MYRPLATKIKNYPVFQNFSGIIIPYKVPCLEAQVDIYMSMIKFYETAWSVLFWSHKNDVTSLIKFWMENTSRRQVYSVNFDKACDVIFMVSK